MEFKRKKLVFTLDEQKHEVKYPTVKQLSDYQSNAKENENQGKDMELLVEFLSNLGLDKEVAYSMEVEHLQYVVEELSGVKKK